MKELIKNRVAFLLILGIMAILFNVFTPFTTYADTVSISIANGQTTFNYNDTVTINGTVQVSGNNPYTTIYWIIKNNSTGQTYTTNTEQLTGGFVSSYQYNCRPQTYTYSCQQYGCTSYQNICVSETCVSGHYEPYTYSCTVYKCICCNPVYGCKDGCCDCGVPGGCYTSCAGKPNPNSTYSCGYYPSTCTDYRWVCDQKQCTSWTSVCTSYGYYWTTCTGTTTVCDTGYTTTYSITKSFTQFGKNYGAGNFTVYPVVSANGTTTYGNSVSFTVKTPVYAPNVTLTVNSSSSITISYDGTNNTDPNVKFTITNLTTGKILLNNSSNKTGSVTDTGLMPNTAYTYRVTATLNGVDAITDKTIYTYANKPISLGYIDNGSPYSVTLQWYNNGNPAGTQYAWIAVNKSNGVPLASGWVTQNSSSSSSVTITNLSIPADQCLFMVKAANGNNIFSSTTYIERPTITANYSNGQVTLTWNPFNHETGVKQYSIYKYNPATNIYDLVAQIPNSNTSYSTSMNEVQPPTAISSLNISNSNNTPSLTITWNASSDTLPSTTSFYITADTNIGSIKSNTVSVTIPASGIKGYSYVVDTNPNTVPDNIIETTSTTATVTIDHTETNYFHIVAVDNAGNISTVYHQQIGIPVLTAIPNNTQNNVSLSWTRPNDGQQYKYMVYKRQQGTTDFQSIPVKQTIKVLEVYPVAPLVNSWASLYGQGKLQVTSIPIENFNANPSQIWNYDVVVFGFADCNGNKDLSPTASSVVEKYIQSGKGVLFGHDTLTTVLAHPNFTRLAPYANITFNNGVPWPPNYNNTTYIKLLKNGFLLNYPNKVGDVNTVLNVPMSHTSAEHANGDIWARFYDSINPNNSINSASDNDYVYATTWNNVGFIQTGHSTFTCDGKSTGINPTPDEQKMVINMIFYLAQITDTTSVTDYSGQDITPPTKPNITNVYLKNNGTIIHVDYSASIDQGTTYEYYVQAESNYNKLQSQIKTATVTVGLKGYSIVIDNNPYTIPDTTIETTSTSYEIAITPSQSFYVHVAAIDNAGNISQVSHYLYQDTTPPTVTISGIPTNWTNQNVVLTITANDTSLYRIQLPSGSYLYASSETLTTTYTVSANGTYTFTAEDRFGNKTTKSVTIDKIDGQPPTGVSVTINNGSAYTNTPSPLYLTLTASDTLSGLNTVRIKVNDKNWDNPIPFSPSITYNVSPGFIKEGTNTVYVEVSDKAGNTTIASDTIIVDTVAPYASINNSQTTLDTLTTSLQIQAYDVNSKGADAISGLDKIRIVESDNQGNVYQATNWIDYSPTINWTFYPVDGMHKIELQAKDKAGNIQTVAKTFLLQTLQIVSAQFTAVVNSPDPTLVLPTSNTIKVKKGYGFTIEVVTSGNPQEVYIMFNGQRYDMINTANNVYNITLTVPVDANIDNQTLPIQIYASKNNGQITKSTTLYVYVTGSAVYDYFSNLLD